MSNEEVLLAQLNQGLLGTFVHGIHTCIAASALWAIFSSKERRTKTRNLMVFVIVFLYILATIFVATNWAFIVSIRITGNDMNANPIAMLVYHWASGVTSGIITGIADCITIWRCWIIWGRCCSVIILPILLFLIQGVCGCLALRYNLNDLLEAEKDPDVLGPSSSQIQWTIAYLSLSLGTTLMCTTFIVYRILTVKNHADDVSMDTSTYCRAIEILVESASLYAISLIGYMVLLTHNLLTSFYPQTIYGSITAITPTLIVARVASGNARPNDSWQANSNASSLRFGSMAHSTSINAYSELTANGLDVDLEQGRSVVTDNHESEHVVNIIEEQENREKGPPSNL
ncbi:hypothetical protein F5146DRAFT_1144759 [Armillaria mellea]|nr:hypothetical protein F5146DRAFT_1144759 [Armillaria mellea]